MASEFGRYLAVVGAAIACGVVTVLASTLIIDPYGISPISIDIPHVNDIKSPRNNLDRFVKPYDIIRMKPNTVIIGTSRVKQTFKPALIPEQFAPAYNAGTDALQMAEARELVAFIGRERVPVRNIWLEVFPLQFGFFPWSPATTPFAGKDVLGDVASAFFSVASLRAVYQTVKTSLMVSDVAVRSDGWKPSGDFGHSGEYFVSPQFKDALRGTGATPLIDSAFDDLAAIVDMCNTYQIELKLFIGPIHPVMSYLYWATNKDALHEWLARVSRKREVISFVTADIFKERELDRPKPYYTDTSHFSVPAATIIMNDLAAYPALKHGRIVNQETAEAAFQEWQEQLRRWIEFNPDFADFVRVTFPKAAAFNRSTSNQ